MDNQKKLTFAIVVICTALIIILILIATPYIAELLGQNKNQTSVGYSSETVRSRVIAIQEEGTTEFASFEQGY